MGPNLYSLKKTLSKIYYPILNIVNQVKPNQPSNIERLILSLICQCVNWTLEQGV